MEHWFTDERRHLLSLVFSPKSFALKGSGAGAAAPKGNPFAAASMMRNMQSAAAAVAAAPHPLNSINQMRLPQMGSPITSMANNLAQQPASNGRAVSSAVVTGTGTKAVKSESRTPKVKVSLSRVFIH